MEFTENFVRGRDTAEKVFIKRKLGRMADTGDRDGSKHELPMILSQDEGNEIKRKFLSEFSPDPPSSNNSSSSLLRNSPRYEVLEEKYGRAMGSLESLGEMAGQAKDELDLSRFCEWKDPMIPEFEKLLIEGLSVSYRIAVKKIVKCGYSEEIAKCAVLRSGPYIDEKDIVSSIVDGALVYLKRKKKIDNSKCRMFEDFDNLVEYMVLEMTCLLREVIPSLSVANAMYFLLIFDLNLLEVTRVVLGDEGQQVISEPQKSEPDPHKKEKGKESGRKINVRHSKKDLLRQNDKGCTSKAKLTSLGARPLVKTPEGIPPKANLKTPMLTPQEKAKSTQKSQIEYYCAGIPYDESQGKYVVQNKNDEGILAAVSRLQDLQEEFRSCNDWAKMAVDLASRRLKPEQAELKILKLEKEETEKFIKEKQILLENTISRLEMENSVLKKKAKDAKKKELQEDEKLKKAMLRKEEALKKSQSIGNEKAVLQDELTALKSKTRALQQEMEKSEAVINQSEVQRGYEESEKMKLLKQAENIRKEGQRIESEAKAEEETVKKVLENIRKERERIESVAKLEEERSEENAKKGLENIRKERERIESVAKVEEERSEENAKKGLEERKDEMPEMEEMMAGLEIKIEDEKKECVVCMTEEKTVVFMPCEHQLLCTSCNEIHEKEGIKDCLCTTPIQERIDFGFWFG